MQDLYGLGMPNALPHAMEEDAVLKADRPRGMLKVDLNDLLHYEVGQAILIPHLPKAKAFKDDNHEWYNVTAYAPLIEDVVVWEGDDKDFLAFLDCLIKGPCANAPLAELTDTRQGGSDRELLNGHEDFIEYLLGLGTLSLTAIAKLLHRERSVQISRGRLRDWLVKDGWMYKKDLRLWVNQKNS